jgi:hypothetical protein
MFTELEERVGSHMLSLKTKMCAMASIHEAALVTKNVLCSCFLLIELLLKSDWRVKMLLSN